MTKIFEILINISQSLWSFLGGFPFLLAIMTFSFTVKFYFVINLFVHMRTNKNWHIRRSCVLLILVLVSAMFSNSAWIIKIIRKLFIPSLNYTFCIFWLRIAWASTVIQYHALALFIESLVEKNRLLGSRQKILVTMTGIFFVALLTLSFFAIHSPRSFGNVEAHLITSILQYCLFPVLSLSVLITTLKLRFSKLPRLLKIQTSVFIKSMIFPFLLLEATHIYPLSILRGYIGNVNACTGIASLILVYAIFYCSRKMIGLRFLNLKTHVESSKNFDFIKNFRYVLDRFSSVTNPRELRHITKRFFEQAFNIPIHKSHLYIKEETIKPNTHTTEAHHETIMEKFLTLHSSCLAIFRDNAVLFADELAFNEFYNNSKNQPLCLELLKKLNADALIPIMDSHKLIAYIIVDRYARPVESNQNKEFYSEMERDYMLVFVYYLKNIINLLHDKNFDTLLHQGKELQEKVYFKHQEINLYKENIRSFVRTSQEKEIGIIFYKNRRFFLGNQAAHDLIKIDLNKHKGVSTTKKLKNIALQVMKYKSPQTNIITNKENKKLVISGIPSTKENNVIIAVHHPEISDLLHKKIDLLQDPSDWNLLLCLETTKKGNIINQLIPGNGEKLLNFKIGLLKTTLSKKPVLLDAPNADLLSIVELIHHASLREVLHTINIERSSDVQEIAIHLFGANPLLGLTQPKIPILKKLNNNGTLFIQNVQLLSREAQEHLAEYIKYGVYRNIKSDNRIPSNVRIICSTNQDLRDQVEKETFSKTLFEALEKNKLTMPLLPTLTEDEFDQLAIELRRQIVNDNTFNNLLGFSEREKKSLFNHHCASLHELRKKIRQALVKKSKTEPIDDQEDYSFKMAYSTSDPNLVEAAQLGRHALKDPRIMAILWKKFKNQNKIAIFLGVNRSSVNRRCKEYNLIP